MLRPQLDLIMHEKLIFDLIAFVENKLHSKLLWMSPTTPTLSFLTKVYIFKLPQLVQNLQSLLRCHRYILNASAGIIQVFAKCNLQTCC